MYFLTCRIICHHQHLEWRCYIKFSRNSCVKISHIFAFQSKNHQLQRERIKRKFFSFIHIKLRKLVFLVKRPGERKSIKILITLDIFWLLKGKKINHQKVVFKQESLKLQIKNATCNLNSVYTNVSTTATAGISVMFRKIWCTS